MTHERQDTVVGLIGLPDIFLQFGDARFKVRQCGCLGVRRE